MPTLFQKEWPIIPPYFKTHQTVTPLECIGFSKTTREFSKQFSVYSSRRWKCVSSRRGYCDQNGRHFPTYLNPTQRSDNKANCHFASIREWVAPCKQTIRGSYIIFPLEKCDCDWCPVVVLCDELRLLGFHIYVVKQSHLLRVCAVHEHEVILWYWQTSQFHELSFSICSH